MSEIPMYPDEDLDEDVADTGTEAILREQIEELETRLSTTVSARDLTIRDLRALLREAEDRLDQYTGMCACPGVSCVESCGECHKTQALVNRIYAVTKSPGLY